MIDYFLKGGFFMWPILGFFIFGLAVSIERLWSLTRASINTKKFMTKIQIALKEGGVGAAQEVCENTRGPIASIFHAGLSRFDKGIEQVEKSIVSAGSIEMAFLERGLVWLSLCISVAPMIGFLGTVQGMIMAFEDIAAANDISPAIVATGIAVALLTTLFGLCVAIIIQFFHNLFVSKIDKLIIEMEESSVELVDTLIDLQKR
jgi:biopolymer transport protein ExbB